MKIDHLSHSKESTLAICGQAFAYRYGEGLIRPPGVAMVRGKGPHKGLEVDLLHVIEHGKPAPLEAVEEACADEIRKQFRGEVRVDGDYLGMTPRQARALVETEGTAITRKTHFELVPAMRPVAVEQKITAQVEGLPVPYVGVLDVVEEHGVRDFKTGRKAPEADRAHGSEQLTAYRILFRALKGYAPAKLSLEIGWRTPSGDVKTKSLPTTRTDADEHVKIARSQAALRVIEAETWLPAEVGSWKCSEKYCGYTDVCPYFRGRPRPKT